MLFPFVAVVAFSVAAVTAVGCLCSCWRFLGKGLVDGVHLSNDDSVEGWHGGAHLVGQVRDHLL